MDSLKLNQAPSYLTDFVLQYATYTSVMWILETCSSQTLRMDYYSFKAAYFFELS